MVERNFPMKKIYFFIAITCWLMGCGNNPSPLNNIGPKISEIRENGKLQMAFLYNKQGYVTEIQKYYSDGRNVWESWRYEYEGSRVVKQEYWSSHPLHLSTFPAPGKPLALQWATKYEYASNQPYPSKVITYSMNNPKEVSSYQLNSYDNSGRLLKSERFTPDGQTNGVSVYEYDQRGNLLFWGGSYWEYDTKPSPLRKLNVPYWNPSWPSPNNVTANFGLDANGNKANVWRYEYTYDAVSGFPATYKLYVDNKFMADGEYVYEP